MHADPSVLAPLKLHYLRWILFDVGSGLHFMYQGIFDTDFDKYLEDAVALFVKTGITTVFINLEGGGGGFADSYYQPLILGWRKQRSAIRAIYGFLAPTGRFSAGANTNSQDIVLEM